MDITDVDGLMVMHSRLLQITGAMGEGHEAADHDGGGCGGGLHPPQGPL